MRTHHWVGGVILAIVFFVLGMWYGKGKIGL
jgi:hypothetical protein